MSDGYRYEQGTWTDGLGTTHDVVDFYVPGDDESWAQFRREANGTLERMISRGPIYLRTSIRYTSADDALAAIKTAHRAWLAGKGWAA